MFSFSLLTLLVLLFSFPSSLIGAQFSLFFHPQELISMKEPRNIEHAGLSLSAILYTDKDHWSLWINNHVICPENAHTLTGFKIKTVTPDEVTFSHIPREGEPEKEFTLRP